MSSSHHGRVRSYGHFQFTQCGVHLVGNERARTGISSHGCFPSPQFYATNAPVKPNRDAPFGRLAARYSYSYDRPRMHPMLRIDASVGQEFEKSTVESCSSEVKGESRALARRTCRYIAAQEETCACLYVCSRRRYVSVSLSRSPVTYEYAYAYREIYHAGSVNPRGIPKIHASSAPSRALSLSSRRLNTVDF